MGKIPVVICLGACICFLTATDSNSVGFPGFNPAEFVKDQIKQEIKQQVREAVVKQVIKVAGYDFDVNDPFIKSVLDGNYKSVADFKNRYGRDVYNKFVNQAKAEVQQVVRQEVAKTIYEISGRKFDVNDPFIQKVINGEYKSIKDFQKKYSVATYNKLIAQIKANGYQQPHVEMSSANVAPLSSVVDPQDIAWANAESSASIDGFQRYLNEYPKGKYSSTARKQIKALQAAAAAEAAAKRQHEIEEANEHLKAAKAGNIEAMKIMAHNYETGTGVRQDSSKAKYWKGKLEAAATQQLLQSANAGDFTAMQKVAILYNSGIGVEKNPEQAEFWRNKVNEARNQSYATYMQSRIDNFSYWQGVDHVNDQIRQNPTAIIALPFATVSDITSYSSRKSELERLKNEAVLRPAAWDYSDSMIGQVVKTKGKKAKRVGLTGSVTE